MPLLYGARGLFAAFPAGAPAPPSPPGAPPRPPPPPKPPRPPPPAPPIIALPPPPRGLGSAVVGVNGTGRDAALPAPRPPRPAAAESGRAAPAATTGGPPARPTSVPGLSDGRMMTSNFALR